MPLGDRASPLGLILKRARSDWLVLTAALLTVVMGTALLAAGPIYADAVTLSTLRQTLRDAQTSEVNISIEIGALPDQIGDLDGIAASVTDLDRIDTSLIRAISIGTYELPTQASLDATDVVEFQYLEDLAAHAALTAGRWPTTGGARIETTISEAAAGLLGVRVGDELALTNRRDRSDRHQVRVVGTYRPLDADDPYWFGEELALAGVASTTSFNTYGPFVIDRTTALTQLGNQRMNLTWRVFPDVNSIDVGELPAVASAVAALESRLNNSLGAAGVGNGLEYRVSTQLHVILRDVERSLAVTRSGVLMVTTQLAILAGYALALTAGLLVESRRAEMALLRARGAGNRQSLLIASVEAGVLTIPAALVAPWLASYGLQVLNAIGPLAAIELRLDPRVTTTAYAIALVAAIGSAVALAIPAYRASRTFNQTFLERGRQGTRGPAQRLGIDLALLTLAALAIWQLETFGPQITAAGRRVIGVDPLLVLAPAIGLFTGAVLALRVVPMLARGGEKLVAVSRSAVAALSAWQVARRPLRYSRSGLLLIMAIAIGFFTATYSDTWLRSQGDQAAYGVGGDLRVSPNRRTNDSLTDLHLKTAHLSIDGVTSAMPVTRFTTQLARSASVGQFLLIDAKDAASVVAFRPDLAERPLEAMLDDLQDGRPELATISLSGKPKRMALVLDLRVEPLEWTPSFELRDRALDAQHDFLPTVRVTIQDGAGLLHRLDFGSIPINRGPARLETDLVERASGGTQIPPTYPISIVEVEVIALAPFHTLRTGSLSLSRVLASDRTTGEGWDVVVDAGSVEWDLSAVWFGGLFASPAIEQLSSTGAQALVAGFSTGLSFEGFRAAATPIHFSLRPSGTRLPGVIPVIVSERLLPAMAVSVGDEIRLADLGEARAEIVGTVEAFPTVDPGSGDVIIADLPTFQMLSHQTGANPRPSDEWWLESSEGMQEAISSQLIAEPIASASVLTRDQVISSLTSDPIALGTIGSLSIGFIAATVFAGVGFAVSAGVSVRERISEFAMLRALGLSPPQLLRWVVTEHGTLLVTGLGLGSVLGWLLGALTIPVISITQDGSPAVPEVVISHPWLVILLLESGIFAGLALLVFVLSRSLATLALGSILRIGND